MPRIRRRSAVAGRERHFGAATKAPPPRLALEIDGAFVYSRRNVAGMLKQTQRTYNSAKNTRQTLMELQPFLQIRVVLRNPKCTAPRSRCQASAWHNISGFKAQGWAKPEPDPTLHGILTPPHSTPTLRHAALPREGFSDSRAVTLRHVPS